MRNFDTDLQVILAGEIHDGARPDTARRNIHYQVMEIVGDSALRDYFAGQALAGLHIDASSGSVSWFEQIGAAGVYKMADAMLAERNKGTDT